MAKGAGVAALVLGALAVISGCAPQAPANNDDVDASTSRQGAEVAVEPEEVRVPPPWTQADSPSPAEACKVRYDRSSASGNSQARQSVGFPVSSGTLPIEGSVNIIAAMVAFDDAPAPALTAESFFGPQLEKITQWSDHWSQGKLRYEFQMVEDWVRVPVNHAAYPINSRDNQALARQNSAKIVQLVVDALPADIDYRGADGFLIYWAPGIDKFDSDVATRGNDGVVIRTPQGSREMFFWSGNNFHYRDSGAMTAEIKREHTWSLWIYFMLLSQGLMLHAPGNGWPTGLGQSQIPSPHFSAAIPVWDAFRLGWVDDSQVHCIRPEDLGDTPIEVMVTPQEVYGGERRTVIVPLEATTDVLVVESRRPTGYSQWPESESGLLVYTVNPSVGQVDLMSPESQRSCGNNDDFSKWAYYLYPDSVNMATLDCNDFRAAFVREGDTLTHNGLRIALEFSADELDYVSITRVGDGG